MTAGILKQIFDPYINLHIQVWNNFEKLGEIREYLKDAIIKEVNTTEKYLNIIIF